MPVLHTLISWHGLPLRVSGRTRYGCNTRCPADTPSSVSVMAHRQGAASLARHGYTSLESRSTDQGRTEPLSDTESNRGLLARITRWLRAEDVAEREEEDDPMYARAETRLIVGLGNPGRQYANTRHNAGWMVIDEIAKRASATGTRNRLHAEITEARYKGYRIVLAKPQTYMNDSGKSVRELLNWYKVGTDDLLIVMDELDLPFGRLRLRPDGSAGGHNGLKSVIREIGTNDFPRLRVGIGRPEQAGKQAIGHVLGTFSPEEQAQLNTVITAAADTVDGWLEDGLLATMNAINGVSSVVSQP